MSSLLSTTRYTFYLIKSYFEVTNSYQILLKCDLDKYDERWECSPSQAVKILTSRLGSRNCITHCNSPSCQGKQSCKKSKPSKAAILDLRRKEDFNASHIRGSTSSPLEGLSSTVKDVFGDSNVVYACWTGLKHKFEQRLDVLGSKATPLLILCYDGEVSRLATSILQAKGYKALNVAGGFPALNRFVGARK